LPLQSGAGRVGRGWKPICGTKRRAHVLPTMPSAQSEVASCGSSGQDGLRPIFDRLSHGNADRVGVNFCRPSAVWAQLCAMWPASASLLMNSRKCHSSLMSPGGFMSIMPCVCAAEHGGGVSSGKTVFIKQFRWSLSDFEPYVNPQENRLRAIRHERLALRVLQGYLSHSGWLSLRSYVGQHMESISTDRAIRLAFPRVGELRSKPVKAPRIGTSRYIIPYFLSMRVESSVCVTERSGQYRGKSTQTWRPMVIFAALSPRKSPAAELVEFPSSDEELTRLIRRPLANNLDLNAVAQRCGRRSAASRRSQRESPAPSPSTWV